MTAKNRHGAFLYPIRKTIVKTGNGTTVYNKRVRVAALLFLGFVREDRERKRSSLENEADRNNDRSEAAER